MSESESSADEFEAVLKRALSPLSLDAKHGAEVLGLDDDTQPSKTWARMDGRERLSRIWGIFWKVCAVVILLYFFLFGLALMGDAFKLMGGKQAGSVFSFVNNPIAGLMVGIFATVLVQSSSTTTSIVVGLVSADALTVRAAIPIVMGANIGTSVTNTIVSLVHAPKRDEFSRAFAGATVHDFFNILAVIVLLPIEYGTHYLELLSEVLTRPLSSSAASEFDSPIKKIVDPLKKKFLSVNKCKIKLISHYPDVSDTEFYERCIEKECDFCEEDTLVEGGFFVGSGLSDSAIGGICLAISLTVIILALFLLVKVLSRSLKGNASRWIRRALGLSAYLSMLVGVAVTVVVQSSSITTSTLVPLVGIGVVTLEQMFPLTLGANIGTTCTALIAAVSEGKVSGMQIALCHLLFNVSGILVWYPIKTLRRVPLGLAASLGYQVGKRRWLALVYTLTVFVIVPVILLVLSNSGHAAMIAGLTILLFLLVLCFVWRCIRIRRPEWVPEGCPGFLKPNSFVWTPEGKVGKGKELNNVVVDAIVPTISDKEISFSDSDSDSLEMAKRKHVTTNGVHEACADSSGSDSSSVVG